MLYGCVAIFLDKGKPKLVPFFRGKLAVCLFVCRFRGGYGIISRISMKMFSKKSMASILKVNFWEVMIEDPRCEQDADEGKKDMLEWSAL